MSDNVVPIPGSNTPLDCLTRAIKDFPDADCVAIVILRKENVIVNWSNTPIHALAWMSRVLDENISKVVQDNIKGVR